MSRELRRGAGFLTERTTRDGRTRWQARWQEPDATGRVRWRAKTFGDERQAAQWLEARDHALRRGRPVAAAELTVDALVAEILDRRARDLSPRTILTYRDRARKMIAPYLGARRLIDLETIDVQRWIDQLGRDGYQPASIHAAVAVLHTVLRDAAILGLIERNVAEGIRRPGIEAVRVQTWTAAQARAFLATVREDEVYGALYHVALATGMRPGELRALPWSDVDLERGRIVVNHTMSKDADGRTVIVPRTKTRRGRAVAIPAPVVAILRWHRARQAERRLAAGETWHPLGLVFDRGDGYWIAQNTWRQRHAAFCRQACVPFTRAHDLRHISASLELEAGTHPKIVADRLGHSTVSMTVDRYSHVDADLQRRAAEALADRIMGDDVVADDDETGTT